MWFAPLGLALSAHATPSTEVCVRAERPLRDEEPAAQPPTRTQSYARLRDALVRGRPPERPEGLVVERFLDGHRFAGSGAGAAPGEPGNALQVGLYAASHPDDPQRRILGLRAVGPEDDHTRAPVNVTWLVDVSSSMRSVFTRRFSILEDVPPGADGLFPPVTRVDLTRAILLEWLEGARTGDRTAIVTFGSGAPAVVLEPTPASSRDRFRRAVDRLESQPGAASGAPLQLAWEVAERFYDPCDDNVVVVVTDTGVPTGALGRRPHLRIGEQADAGPRLSVLTVGTHGSQSPEADRLAWWGHGDSTYASTLSEGRASLDALFGSDQVVARSLDIRLSFPPDQVLRVERLDQASGETALTVDSVRAGQSFSALYEVQLTADGGDGPWVRAAWSWDDLGGGERAAGARELRRADDSDPTRADEVVRAWVAAAVERGLAGEDPASWPRLRELARATARTPADQELVLLIDLAAREQGT